MFGMGTWELAILAGVILLVAGPTLLPRLGRTLGQSIKDLKASTETFGANLREEMETTDEPAQLTDGLTDPAHREPSDEAARA